METAIKTRYDFSNDYFSTRIPSFEKFLAPLADAPCSLIEVGCLQGRSTTWLVDNILKHPQSRLECIDINALDELLQNIQKTGCARQVTFRQGLSREILRQLPLSSYDFIYLDGSHSTIDVLEDAVLSFRLAKVGAIIALDDYPWDEPPYNDDGVPKPAIDAFLELYAQPTRYRKRVKILEHNWQVWVRKLCD
jgi:predicted O-methyltransferase YrrM